MGLRALANSWDGWVCCSDCGDLEKVLTEYPLNAGNWVPREVRVGLTITPGVLLMMMPELAELAALLGVEPWLFGVKLTTGDNGSEELGVEGDDEADIFAIGGMSIVRVSLPKISRSRLVGAGNAIGDRLGGVT